MAETDRRGDTLDPRTLHIPERGELPEPGLRIVYDRAADTLSVDFYGRPLPAVSVAVDHGERDYLYLRVDPESRKVVGLQIEAFLAYATKQDPALLCALLVADIRGFNDLDAAQIRRLAQGALREWDEAAFLDDVGALIA